jgi:hypothetical protein
VRQRALVHVAGSAGAGRTAFAEGLLADLVGREDRRRGHGGVLPRAVSSGAADRHLPGSSGRYDVRVPRPDLSRRARSRIDRAVSGAPRLVCIAGRSGIGKTAHLRAAFRASNREARWTTAREAVDEMAAAVRANRYERWCEVLENDPRPLVMEHLEDLRGRPRTLAELRRGMERRLSHGGTTILTLTLTAAADDVLDSVSQYAAVICDGRPRRS